MLTLLVLILLAVLFFRFLGRVGVGLLILFPVIIIGLLFLKLAIVALPIILIIGLLALIMRSSGG